MSVLESPSSALETPGLASNSASPERRRSPWPRFLLGRILGGVGAVFGACTLVFIMIAATGNPIRLLLAGAASDEEIARLTAEHGYDRPVLVQYLVFLRDVATGSFPPSLRMGVNPFGPVLTALGNTLALTILAIIIGALAGLVIGYLTVVLRNRFVVNALLTGIFALQAIPSFFLGIVLVLLFGLILPIFPTSGSGTPLHLVLPALTLAAVVAPGIARVFRTSLLETLGQDHVLAARAKGTPAAPFLRRHVIANALAPVISLLGVQSGSLLAGAILVESVFAWPGLGALTVDAVTNQDYSVVIAAVVVIATTFVTTTVLADIVVAILNPQFRVER